MEEKQAMRRGMDEERIELKCIRMRGEKKKATTTKKKMKPKNEKGREGKEERNWLGKPKEKQFLLVRISSRFLFFHSLMPPFTLFNWSFCIHSSDYSLNEQLQRKVFKSCWGSGFSDIIDGFRSQKMINQVLTELSDWFSNYFLPRTVHFKF